MKIDDAYIDRMRSAVTIYTKRRTSDILEGNFRSLYRGRSLEFDDLKEYQPGDDVHDIDWKSSSRTGKTLIRRYVAQRRLNMLFVADAGAKMTGDTPSGAPKKEVALALMCVIACLADRQGAAFNGMVAHEQAVRYGRYQSGNLNLSRLLHDYDRLICRPSKVDIAQTLDFAVSYETRPRLIFVLTDIDGLTRIDERLLRKACIRNDVFVIEIEDAFMTGEDILEVSAGRLVRPLIARSRRLHEEELKLRAGVEGTFHSMCVRNRVMFTSIASEAAVMDKVMELLSRYRYEDFG